MLPMLNITAQLAALSKPTHISTLGNTDFDDRRPIHLTLGTKRTNVGWLDQSTLYGSVYAALEYLCPYSINPVECPRFPQTFSIPIKNRAPGSKTGYNDGNLNVQVAVGWFGGTGNAKMNRLLIRIVVGIVSYSTQQNCYEFKSVGRWLRFVIRLVMRR